MEQRRVPSSKVPDRYRIGAVSRLTGIPAVTLRAWERRYEAVTAQRDSGGSRLYSVADVERLVLIKRLVDLGNAISTVARLPLEELQQRLAVDREQMRQSHASADGGIRRVAVAGVTLARRMRTGADALQDIEILSAQNTPAEMLNDLHGRQVDVIVLEYMTLQAETMDEIRNLLRQTRALRAVVVYGFAPRTLVDSLGTQDIVALSAPVNLSELRLASLVADLPDVTTQSAALHQLADDAVTADPEQSIPARLFSSQELQRLSEVSSSIDCECPQHLGSLIRSLVSFETYSSECANRNADDAALHAYLHRTSAHARAAMERALERVARAEGLLD